MQNLKENKIVELTFQFSLDIIAYVEKLEEQKKYVFARQLLKSGTSIGANVREAKNAESKIDFIHKMKIAAKEADETQYWIELCNKSVHYPNNQLEEKLHVIIKILSKIIATSKKVELS